MKILAVNMALYDREIANVIAVLDRSELQSILGKAHYEKVETIHTGDTVDITDRYRHGIAVVDKVNDAKKLPRTLRTLAEMLEMNHPALTAVADEAPAA